MLPFVSNSVLLVVETSPAIQATLQFRNALPALVDRFETWRAGIDMPKLMLEVGLALAVGFIVYGALSALIRIAKGRAARMEGGGVGRLVRGTARVVGAASPLFIFVVAFTAASEMVTLPPKVHDVIHAAFIIGFFIQGAVLANIAARGWLNDYTTHCAMSDSSVAGASGIIAAVISAVIWAIAALLMLDNLGVNVTALIAGLGIGGIAIGLAAQNILGDLFGSLAILLDKPFVVGDFIIMNEHMGTVEHIGLKTTRLRSLSGEQLVISNGDLLTSRIRNYKRMGERRVVFTVGVTYDTPREKLERIPGMIRKAIENQSPVRFDRSHFATFGASSLDFESVYYVLSREYNQFMDIQQAINFELVERFAAEGLQFAFPTRTIHIESVPGQLLAGRVTSDGKEARPAPGSAS